MPTVDPFVIASGEVRATRSVLVRARLHDGEQAGLGEASCLPPVTKEDQPDCLQAVQRAIPVLVGRTFDSLSALEAALDEQLGAYPVARTGVEVAVLDALARRDRVPLWRWLGGPAVAPVLETDITLPILHAARMAELAAHWWSLGFRKLKVKAGRSLDADVERLEAIVRVVPHAQFQPDANAGLSVSAALAYLDAAARLGAKVTCFEQPCATTAELAEVAARCSVPVIADESVTSMQGLTDVLAHPGIGGVNLKLAKTGGLLATRRLGVAAQAAGLKLMVGGMVETRLGMTAATHLAASLGGVDFADLDTAWLLTEERFAGGYLADGPRYQLPDEPGLALEALITA